MAHGYLAFVLHAHLPFVRHPEHARHLEERWFYEALVECYLPLLDAFDRMADDGVPFALTMSVTPPLAAMMRDELLRHALRRAPRSPRGARRARDEAPLRRPAVRADRHLLSRPPRAHARRVGAPRRRRPGGSRPALGRGRLELLTCSATHCYLPGMLAAREGIRPAARPGCCAASSDSSGASPPASWLAECAYHPSFDDEIARGRPPLHRRRHARPSARDPAPSVRRARADVQPERRRVLRARRRVEQAGVVA